MPHMSPRIKLKKGRPLAGHTNVAPTVTILAFVANPVQGVPTAGFAAVATDSEQGDISSSIVWTTTLAGSPTPSAVQVGTGAAPTLTFQRAGAQTVTARVTDGYGASGSATQAITVAAAPGSPPVGSPVGSPAAGSPAAGSPAAGSPVGSPAAGSPVGSPVGSPAGSP